MLGVVASTLFTFATYRSTKGCDFKLCNSRARTNVRHDSFCNQVINDWNNLLANVVDAHGANGMLVSCHLVFYSTKMVSKGDHKLSVQSMAELSRKLLIGWSVFVLFL